MKRLNNQQVTDRAKAAMEDLFGAQQYGQIMNIFAQIEIADEEIRAAQERHPEQAEMIDGLFLWLRPKSDLERKMTLEMYRGHIRELIERVVAGKDTELPTSAEKAWALCETSLEAPLSESASAAYMGYFLDVYGPERMQEVVAMPEEQIDFYLGMHSEIAAEIDRGLNKRMRVVGRTPDNV
jgi:hypothetical protein